MTGINWQYDCLIWRNSRWVQSPLSWIRKGDWFKIPGSDATHVANEDAFQDEDGWHVDADMHRKDQNEKVGVRTER